MDKIQKTEEEWKQILSPEAFHVLRKHGTERAFSGVLNENKNSGIYLCAGCNNILFSSETKFDSGTGWPSFFAPIADVAVETTIDKSFFTTRTEVHCAKCNGHLGHVFNDGPQPTGLRYCMNSVSLTFKNESEL